MEGSVRINKRNDGHKTWEQLSRSVVGGFRGGEDSGGSTADAHYRRRGPRLHNLE